MGELDAAGAEEPGEVAVEAIRMGTTAMKEAMMKAQELREAAAHPRAAIRRRQAKRQASRTIGPATRGTGSATTSRLGSGSSWTEFLCQKSSRTRCKLHSTRRSSSARTTYGFKATRYSGSMIRILRMTSTSATRSAPLSCTSSSLPLSLSLSLSLSCLLYTSPSPRDVEESRMPSSA